MGGREPGNGVFGWPPARERGIWVAASQGAGNMGGRQPRSGEYGWPPAKERGIWAAASQGAGNLGGREPKNGVFGWPNGLPKLCALRALCGRPLSRPLEQGRQVEQTLLAAGANNLFAPVGA